MYDEDLITSWRIYKMTISEYKEELLSEIKGLPAAKIKEILDFVCFIKAKETIDPAQSYFWSKKWQKMEREVAEDKKVGNVSGDGTVEGLLEELSE